MSQNIDMRQGPSAGQLLRSRLSPGQIIPFIGVHDAFSASIASRHFDALFLSGFGFAASHRGLPDIGFITWTDMLDFVGRVRRVAPRALLLVDIDDGYGDTEVACHVVRALQELGAAGVILEDQRRPRRCGHMDGKQILGLDAFLEKLRAVLSARRDLFVIARTDASDPAEIVRRVTAFEHAGSDAVLADGITSLGMLDELRRAVRCPVAFNQIAGGKSPACGLSELRGRGASIAIYSTPCLFAAQAAIDGALRELLENDGSLDPGSARRTTLAQCNQVLFENLRATQA